MAGRLAVAAASVLLLSLLVISSSTSVDAFNYSQVGRDWPVEECQAGKRQSPVNIVIERVDWKRGRGNFSLHYGLTDTLTIENNGHGIVATPEQGNFTLQLTDGNYSLLQFHFHSFSEHAIDGRLAPLELHFVHAHTTIPNKLAVVGVLFDFHPSEANSTAIQKILPHAPHTESKVTGVATPNFSPMELIRETWKPMSYFTYSGSLTTPACSEIVTWHVLEYHQYVSTAQVSDFLIAVSAVNSGQPYDNRLPQPLLGRTVTRYHA